MNHRDIDQAPLEVPIACLLTGDERQMRGAEIVRPLFAGRQETCELPDGYALRFPGEDAWAARLLTFIEGERACCPFFTFGLTFEPQQGPIWLHLRGPSGTREFVAAMLAQADEHGSPPE